MKTLHVLTLLSLLFTAAFAPAQAPNPQPPAEPVKLIFVHHSTGGNWLADSESNELGGDLGKALAQNNYYVSATNYGWGPDSIGDRTDIPDWLEWFRGENSPTYLQALYTENSQNIGDFGNWQRLPQDPGGENQIIVFKSCFPNSALEGSPNDPPDPEGWLSVGHAKYVYNQLLTYFATRPDKLFVIITAPPLSDPALSANARAFNNWLVHNWLSENNYTLPNVAVFDYYNVLTAPDNHHHLANGQIQHEVNENRNTLHYPSGDDHPSRAGNQKATAEFIPLLNAFYQRWKENAPAPLPLPAAENPTAAPTSAPAESAAPAASAATLADFETASGWEGFDDGGGISRMVCAPVSTEKHNGAQSMQMEYSVANGGWATCGRYFESTQNWSAATGITFAAQAETAGQTLHLDIYAGNPEQWATYVYEFTPNAGGWQVYTVRWDEFKRVDWEENAGSPYDPSLPVGGIAFGIPSPEGAESSSGIFRVDDIALAAETSEAPAAESAPASEVQPPAAESAAPASAPLCPAAALLPSLALFWMAKRKWEVKSGKW